MVSRVSLSRWVSKALNKQPGFSFYVYHSSHFILKKREHFIRINWRLNPIKSIKNIQDSLKAYKLWPQRAPWPQNDLLREQNTSGESLITGNNACYWWMMSLPIESSSCPTLFGSFRSDPSPSYSRKLNSQYRPARVQQPFKLHNAWPSLSGWQTGFTGAQRNFLTKLS